MWSRHGLERRGVYTLLGLALLLMAAACRTGRPPESTERVYTLHCLGCHGARGEGTWGSNIQGLKSPVSEIARVISKGEGKMPAYEGHLTEAEITALANYVKAFKLDSAPKPAP
jgi:mono/diheme cytochrome c family protein